MREHYDLLRSTSRTFAVGIEALPGELRDAVTLAYLVLRVSDYFEDSPSLPSDEKRRQLTAWANLLESGGGPSDPADCEPSGGSSPDVADGGSDPANPYAPLLAAVSSGDEHLPDHAAALRGASILQGLGSLRAEYRDPIRRHTASTTRGMAEWVARGDDFPDESALDAYMYEVAGRVGLLLTDLFAAYSPLIRGKADHLRSLAVSFGLGLQTVNVIRGLHEDPARGWTYLPRSLLSTEGEAEAADPKRLGRGGGTGPGDPGDLSDEERARVLDFLVRKSGRHIADALAYCLALPRRERGIRVFCIIPALLASETARRSRGNPAVFREPVKVDRPDVRRIVRRTRLLFFSNGWLERERDRATALASAPASTSDSGSRNGNRGLGSGSEVR